MEKCELSNKELNTLVQKKVYNNNSSILPTYFLDHAWFLVKDTVLGKGTQRGMVNVKGRYYQWICYYNGVKGEAIEPTFERAMTVAVLRAMKLISGGVDPWDNSIYQIPVIGTDLEDN